MYIEKENAQHITLRKKIASMLMFGFHGTSNSDSGVIEIKKEIEKLHIGGVILFDYNITSKKQLKNLTNILSQSDRKLLIAIDQEGGKVQRLNSRKGFEDTCSAQEIALKYNLSEAYHIYDKMAKMLKEHGINFNFAPCVDIDSNPTCPIIGGYGRSFGYNPKEVTQYAEQFIAAHQQHNIITSLKHFPGHGYARGDTHKTLTYVTNYAKPDVELQPYKNLINKSPYLTVMTSHIVNSNLDPQSLPATLSKNIVSVLLREKLGFQGVIVTDDLEMGAIKRHYGLKDVIYKAINAGNNILLFSKNSAASLHTKEGNDWNIRAESIIDIIEEGVSKGIISRSSIDASYRKIKKIKELIISPTPSQRPLHN